MRIFKFGGASVTDHHGVRNVGKIIATYPDQPMVVVISAMGKTTNALETIARLSFEGKSFDQELSELIHTHEHTARELLSEVPEELSLLVVRLKDELKKKASNWTQFYDQIIPFGELMSTTICFKYLQSQFPCVWLDARTVIKTNSIHTEANVDWQLTEHFIHRELPNMLKGGPVITQGFIGFDLTGKTTTLGREGSDYTGAIFAYCLDAESLTVWKDVPGLLNADPKKFAAAELFEELSYQEVTELTYYGAKVIHPKTIRPLAQKEIPLFVRSFVDPKGEGTKIHAQEKIGTTHCFVFKENQLLLTLRVKDNSFMDEKKLVKVFQAMDDANVKINMMHSSALTFTICMDFIDSKLKKLQDFLSKDFSLLYNDGLQLATIKNYQKGSFDLLPEPEEVIMEQKTRNNYQVLYRPKSILTLKKL